MREDAVGVTRVSYNDPDYLARRHGLPTSLDALDRIDDLLKWLADKSTGTD